MLLSEAFGMYVYGRTSEILAHFHKCVKNSLLVYILIIDVGLAESLASSPPPPLHKPPTKQKQGKPWK